MLNIEFKTIPHKEQRLPTIGDYWMDKSGVHFRVSDCKNEKYEFIVLAHEFIEWSLCHIGGVTMQSIDDYDNNFEKRAEKGEFTDWDEPGEQMDAPYHYQHIIATKIERMLAFFMGVDWDKYEKDITRVWNSTRPYVKKKKK